MNKRDKQLLLQDLCARLPYGICANLPNHNLVAHEYHITELNIKTGWTSGVLYCAGRKAYYGAEIKDIKPYLRPLSSMTNEEAMEYANCGNIIANSPQNNYLVPNPNCVDWLNAHHFDYRGLIDKGLALEVPKDMY